MVEVPAPGDQPAEDVQTAPEPPVETRALTEPPPVENVEKPLQDSTRRDSPLVLARQRRDEGKTDEAIRHFKTALIENDNQPGVWAELSQLYFQTGNNRWAQATASEAMRRDPGNSQYVLQFLLAAKETMDVNRFVQEMEGAYKKFPEDPDLLIFMAKVFADQGNTRNARILLEKFLEFAPSNHPERTSAELELSDLGNGSPI